MFTKEQVEAFSNALRYQISRKLDKHGRVSVRLLIPIGEELHILGTLHIPIKVELADPIEVPPEQEKKQ